MYREPMATKPQQDVLTDKVLGRFKTGMSVVLRNVAKHNWGWFSSEDERMHLQTVDPRSLKGAKKGKVWLENLGRRAFEVALVGDLTAPGIRELEAKIVAERDQIEALWIHFMLQNDWLRATLDGSLVTLTAYPKSHNRFTRTFDLRRRFPGAYIHAPTWQDEPPLLEFDKEHGMLMVGNEDNRDHRLRIDLAEHLFVD